MNSFRLMIWCGALTILFMTEPGRAQPAPTSRAEFCNAASDLRNFQELASDLNHRLAFRNRGGIINGGVCWWHSRFQRSATYLAVYRPELQPPTRTEAKQIIRALIRNERVVEIPGYRSLYEFSSEWEGLIQKYLEAWQRSDGVFRFAWVRGLANSPHGNSKKLARIILALADEVIHQRRITYLKLQIRGITAHAWLVIGMRETQSGYEIEAIDSNSLQLVHYQYVWGDHSLRLYGGLMPYIEQRKDFPRIHRAIKNYCLGENESLEVAEGPEFSPAFGSEIE